MIKNLVLGAVAASAAFAAVPAQAAIITPGSSGVMFTPFDGATQGTQLAFTSVSDTALTFSAIMRSAVFRNTLGTLDFYYQVERTGAGSFSDGMINAFTASDFTDITVDGLVSAMDPDGAGFFTGAVNPPGSTTTTGRNATGAVLQTNFGNNGLMGNEISATYIFRTNATRFQTGTFGVINGSTFSGLAFAPTSAIPEPATWAMMIIGFGAIGSAVRYRRRKTGVAYA